MTTNVSMPVDAWRIRSSDTPNLPTKIIPAKIDWLRCSGKFPMDIIPPLKIKITLESNPLKSRILAGRLAVVACCWLADAQTMQ